VPASLVPAVAVAGCSSPGPDVAAPPPAAVTPSADASGVPSAEIGRRTVPGSGREPTELVTLTVVKYGEPTGTSGCPS
jgi:hypothetical protein